MFTKIKAWLFNKPQKANEVYKCFVCGAIHENSPDNEVIRQLRCQVVDVQWEQLKAASADIGLKLHENRGQFVLQKNSFAENNYDVSQALLNCSFRFIGSF